VDGLLEVGQVHTVQQQVALLNHDTQSQKRGVRDLHTHTFVAVAVLELCGFVTSEQVHILSNSNVLCVNMAV
jgi:hypothetical protein